MSFIQYEVWGTFEGHEELLECVPTLKEAERVAEHLLEFNEEIWILEDTDEDLVEVRRYKNTGVIG
jgi:hypothetical protein